MEPLTLHTSHHLVGSFGLQPPASKHLTKIMDTMMYYIAKNGNVQDLVRTLSSVAGYTPSEETNYDALQQAAKQPELIILADDYSAANLWMNLLISIKTVKTIEVAEYELSNIIEILDIQGTSRQAIYAKLKKSVDKVNLVLQNCQIYYTVDMINELVHVAVSTSSNPKDVKVWLNEKSIDNNNLFDAITKNSTGITS